MACSQASRFSPRKRRAEAYLVVMRALLLVYHIPSRLKSLSAAASAGESSSPKRAATSTRQAGPAEESSGRRPSRSRFPGQTRLAARERPRGRPVLSRADPAALASRSRSSRTASGVASRETSSRTEATSSTAWAMEAPSPSSLRMAPARASRACTLPRTKASSSGSRSPGEGLAEEGRGAGGLEDPAEGGPVLAAGGRRGGGG